MEKTEEQKTEPRVWFINNGVKGVNLRSLERCTAVSPTTGKPCGNPRVRNSQFCCVHKPNGYRPGPPKGNQYALKHGMYTGQFLKCKQNVREIVKVCEDICGSL